MPTKQRKLSMNNIKGVLILIILFLLITVIAVAGTVSGKLTATATVSDKLIHTDIPLNNGISITKNLPAGAQITATESNKSVKIVIVY